MRGAEVTHPLGVTSAAVSHCRSAGPRSTFSAVLPSLPFTWTQWEPPDVSKDQGIPRNVKFQGDTPAALGRKACTTEAEEGMEREGHVQDSGRKQLIWEGPWKLKDDSKGPS